MRPSLQSLRWKTQVRKASIKIVEMIRDSIGRMRDFAMRDIAEIHISNSQFSALKEELKHALAEDPYAVNLGEGLSYSHGEKLFYLNNVKLKVQK